MKDGEKNPSYLGSQEWQYFCTGSLGEELVCIGCCQNLQRCQCCYHSVLQSLIQQLLEPRHCSVPCGWCCRCPMKSDFQGGCLLSCNHFVSQIQHWVGEVSQRKMGLTCSHMLHDENLLSSFSAPALICHWNGLRWQGKRLNAEGFLETGTSSPLSQRLLWTVGGWTPEWLHKGFQALVHDLLKIL